MPKVTNTIDFVYGATTAQADMRPNAIYLDGVVQGPVIDNARRSYSFDHHAGCVRAFTLATCQQVHIALQLGFDPIGLDIVVNDLDADTVLAVWLLFVDAEVRNDPRVTELVERVGFMDSHGPAVPGHPAHPVHHAIGAGFKDTQSLQLLDDKLDLLDKWYTTGGEPEARADRPARAFGLTLSGRLTDLGHVNGFEDIYGAGCVVGIVAIPGPNDTTGWTIGKLSDFVAYDVTAFLARANAIEPGWGGGSTIGGAPRLEGGLRSSLTRSQVEALLTNA